MSLTEEFLAQADALYQGFQAHDALQSDRLQRFRSIEPESARVLAVLIRAQQARKILEIGTSTGYSTLWLANAAQSMTLFCWTPNAMPMRPIGLIWRRSCSAKAGFWLWTMCCRMRLKLLNLLA